MIVERMIEAAVKEFKENLLDLCKEKAEEALTPESAQWITRGIQQALALTGRAAFKEYLESKETAQEAVMVGGEVFRFKYPSDKRTQTLWGIMDVMRRVYQNASDTKSHVP